MWDLLATLPVTELNKIDNKYIDKYHPVKKKAGMEKPAPKIAA
jgi:V/A-type H+-transporting ATPase subunit B